MPKKKRLFKIYTDRVRIKLRMKVLGLFWTDCFIDTSYGLHWWYGPNVGDYGSVEECQKAIDGYNKERVLEFVKDYL